LRYQNSQQLGSDKQLIDRLESFQDTLNSRFFWFVPTLGHMRMHHIC